MSVFNLFIIGCIITAIFLIGVGLTVSEFNDIESGTTDRRKHIDEDMRVDH